MRTLFFSLALFFIWELKAQELPKSPQVSFQSFLELAEKNDLNFEKVLAEKSRLNFLVDQGLPTRQLLLSAQQEYGFAQGSGEDTSILTITAGKEILETGTHLSVSRVHTERPDRTEDVTEIRLRQSLWQNLLGRDSRLKKDSLETQKRILQLQILDSYEDYLSEIAKLYLDYSQAYIDVELARQIHKESKNIQSNVIQKKRVSIATQTDVDRVELDVLLSHEVLAEKEKVFESLRQQVVAVVGDRGLDFQPQLNLNLDSQLGIQIPESLDFSGLRVTQRALLQEQVLEKELTFEKRASSPDLDLVLGHDVDHSTRFGSSVNRDSSVVGVSVQVPFGDTTQKAQVQEASLNLTQGQLDKHRALREAKSRFEDLKNQLRKSQEQLKLSERKMILTERILNDERKRYQRGTLSLEDLIETRKDFSEYRFSYQANLADYNKVIVDWLSFSDQFLQKSIL